jgi:hypothetical protein
MDGTLGRFPPSTLTLMLHVKMQVCFRVDNHLQTLRSDDMTGHILNSRLGRWVELLNKSYARWEGEAGIASETEKRNPTLHLTIVMRDLRGPRIQNYPPETLELFSWCPYQFALEALVPLSPLYQPSSTTTAATASSHRRLRVDLQITGIGFAPKFAQSLQRYIAGQGSPVRQMRHLGGMKWYKPMWHWEAFGEVNEFKGAYAYGSQVIWRELVRCLSSKWCSISSRARY